MNADNTPLVNVEKSPPIYFVGIGASADGLEAIERFFATATAHRHDI
ncbi:MAG: hypothetical protein FD168_2014 [Desulfobulbaceae bacterium]|nr:MAG: hypothetical protein FD168_2014 [Desulfobulbaceae bacterium]